MKIVHCAIAILLTSFHLNVYGMDEKISGRAQRLDEEQLRQMQIDIATIEIVFWLNRASISTTNNNNSEMIFQQRDHAVTDREICQIFRWVNSRSYFIDAVEVIVSQYLNKLNSDPSKKVIRSGWLHILPYHDHIKDLVSELVNTHLSLIDRADIKRQIINLIHERHYHFNFAIPAAQTYYMLSIYNLIKRAELTNDPDVIRLTDGIINSNGRNMEQEYTHQHPTKEAIASEIAEAIPRMPDVLSEMIADYMPQLTPHEIALTMLQPPLRRRLKMGLSQASAAVASFGNSIVSHFACASRNK